MKINQIFKPASLSKEDKVKQLFKRYESLNYMAYTYKDQIDDVLTKHDLTHVEMFEGRLREDFPNDTWKNRYSIYKTWVVWSQQHHERVDVINTGTLPTELREQVEQLLSELYEKLYGVMREYSSLSKRIEWHERKKERNDEKHPQASETT